jgi:hypothetical protein
MSKAKQARVGRSRRDASESLQMFRPNEGVARPSREGVGNAGWPMPPQSVCKG